MQVTLLHHAPLWVASKAIRKCWASEGHSDTEEARQEYAQECILQGDYTPITTSITGPNDKALIDRIGNKNKHASTLEHLVYTFDIDGISRACLQELARHRIASLSVKSSRYTLKELKATEGVESLRAFLVLTGSPLVDDLSVGNLYNTRKALYDGIPNDVAKYSLPEAYKTSLEWTINARSLQNFLLLRTDKAALWEIRELAHAIFLTLPEDHKYLFAHCIYGSEAWRSHLRDEAEGILLKLDGK